MPYWSRFLEWAMNLCLLLLLVFRFYINFILILRHFYIKFLWGFPLRLFIFFSCLSFILSYSFVPWLCKKLWSFSIRIEIPEFNWFSLMFLSFKLQKLTINMKCRKSEHKLHILSWHVTILNFPQHFLETWNCYILMQTPLHWISGSFWLQSYEQFIKAKNSIKPNNFNSSLANISKTIFATSDSYPLYVTYTLCDVVHQCIKSI